LDSSQDLLTNSQAVSIRFHIDPDLYDIIIFDFNVDRHFIVKIYFSTFPNKRSLSSIVVRYL